MSDIKRFSDSGNQEGNVGDAVCGLAALAGEIWAGIKDKELC